MTALAHKLLAARPDLLTEAEFSSLIVDVARLAGWRKYHTHNSRRSSFGFPDWILVKDDRMLAVELKTEKGKVKPDQQAWLDALARVPGVDSFVWRPSDWDQVVETLTGRKPSRKAAA
ncbi:MAG: VRR-NUC domain-containing protein [Actinomycetota bacterium]|nr:VRR-NUC domain-containing protein [Actinomycetota bacterium]